MSQEAPTFDVEIKSNGDFCVGQDKKNEFSITVKIKGTAGQLQFNDCTFSLRVGIGDKVEDLVLSEEMAEKIGVTTGGFQMERFLSSNQQFVWKFYSYDETPFTRENPLTLTFSDVESCTEVGSAKLTFEADISGTIESYPKELTKKSGESGFVYFYSTTEERVKSQTTNSIFPADEQILSGEKVTFHWSVNNLSNLAFIKGGVNFPITPKELEKGEKEVTDLTADNDFYLSGVDIQGRHKTSQKVGVKVLTSGWHVSTTTVDGEQLEPTCVFSADAGSPIFYAMFRRKLRNGQAEGLLFRTENPFWGWSQMPGKVPASFSTSPGLFYDNKLWLVGGSQIDPEVTSNEILVTAITQNSTSSSERWKKLEVPSPWCPRMGHAVLVYDKEIWVLGGCDENGNSLNDCWKYNVSARSWSGFDSEPLWGNRCMFSAVPFNNNNRWEIWLCGGVKEPFSDDFLKDLYVYSKGTWGPRLTPKEDLGPLSLQVFRDRPHLIGQTTKSPFRTFFYEIEPSKTDELRPRPSDQLQGWSDNRNVAWQLANFKNRLLVAKALGYDRANCDLKVFVP